MRPSDSTALAVSFAFALSACSISLDDSREAKGAGGSGGGAGPTVDGCLLFSGDASAPSGAGRSISEPSGGYLWVFDDGWATVGEAGPCAGKPTLHAGSIVDATALPDHASAVALGGTQDFVYFTATALDPSQPYGVRAEGFGVAARHGERYVAQHYLWTSDRPSFGQAVLVEDGFVYAYGCRVIASSFTSDCYVARVPEAKVDDAKSYTYADGSGHWIDGIDAAPPITTAGPTLSVVHDLEQQRYVMTYVPVLGGTLVARSGLGPAGPWSAEVTVATVVLPSGAFANGGLQHPEVDPGKLNLSYAPATFGSTAKHPKDYWPCLVTLPFPELP